MSEERQQRISDFISQEVSRFSSSIENFCKNSPDQQTFIVQEVRRYASDLLQLAQHIKRTGVLIQSHAPSQESEAFLSTSVQSSPNSSGETVVWFESHSSYTGPDHLNTSGGTYTQTSINWDDFPNFDGHEFDAYLQLSEDVAGPKEMSDAMELCEDSAEKTSGYGTDFAPAERSIDPTTLILSQSSDARSRHSVSASQSLSTLSTLPHLPELNVEPIGGISHCSSLAKRSETGERRPATRRNKRTLAPQAWMESEMPVVDSIQGIEKIKPDRLSMIMNMYHSVGSAEALLQLKGILSRQNVSDTPTWKVNVTSAKEISQSLDNLDHSIHACALRRRILHFYFIDYRDRRLNELRSNRRSVDESSEPGFSGRATSKVLDVIVNEFYTRASPGGHQSPQEGQDEGFRNDKIRVKNRLYIARNWQRAVKRFGLGFLALFPSGGTYSIHNHKYETLLDSECEILLELLERKNGGCIRVASTKLTPSVQAMCDGIKFPGKFRFESVDDPVLRTVDSSKLVELCEQIQGSDSQAFESP